MTICIVPTILQNSFEGNGWAPLTTTENGLNRKKTKTWRKFRRFQPEPIEPLEWKASENRLKPSMIEPPKLELKELLEHLEYAFLQGDDKLPLVISSASSAPKKTKLLEVLKNHKGAFAWSITDIKGIDNMEVFMDDFLVFGSSFNHCLNNMEKMLKRWLFEAFWDMQCDIRDLISDNGNEWRIACNATSIVG
ncbi:hypothetical protein Tco_1327540 [Tanacetum coccineum]